MNVSTSFVLVAVVVLAIVAGLVFFAGGKRSRGRLTPLGSVAFACQAVHDQVEYSLHCSLLGHIDQEGADVCSAEGRLGSHELHSNEKSLATDEKSLE